MRIFKLCIFVIITLLASSRFADASLLVTPKRLVFGERDRSHEIVLINPSNTMRTYRIEWSEKKQLSSGGYRDLTAEELTRSNKASNIVRFSPRQVRLQPGERQVVKLVARRPANMTSGEYRSHLMFTALPSAEETVPGPVDGIQMKLNLLISYSIPVMVNTGYQDPTVSITSLEITPATKNKQTKAKIILRLKKTVGFSAYGNLKAYFRPNDNADFTQVGVLNGVNFFGETSDLTANLTWMGDMPNSKGELKVEFVGQEETAGKIWVSRIFDANL
jgi:P pilus assembly chaperone PapD